MLKVDLHLHSKEDTNDCIDYTAKELIDLAEKKNFDVLSFTFHDSMFFPPDVVEYAKNKGILLIPGIEKTIEGKHVLLYNFTEEELNGINRLEDLEVKKERLIIAPHPFYKDSSCLGKKLAENIERFDGVEMCYLYSNLIDFNKKAEKIASEYKKTFIANSDCHFIDNFGSHYSTIDSPQEINAIIEAIKKGKVRNVTKKISTFKIIKDMWRHYKK